MSRSYKRNPVAKNSSFDREDKITVSRLFRRLKDNLSLDIPNGNIYRKYVRSHALCKVYENYSQFIQWWFDNPKVKEEKFDNWIQLKPDKPFEIWFYERWQRDYQWK